MGGLDSNRASSALIGGAFVRKRPLIPPLTRIVDNRCDANIQRSLGPQEICLLLLRPVFVISRREIKVEQETGQDQTHLG